jgi:KDO2-lipid IV(A) lauroyltransferase
MKQRSRSLDYLVYLIVRFVVAVLQALPFGAALRFADGLAWLAYRINKRHRKVADENLRHAFGDQYSDAERDRLVRAVYRHFCRVVIEMMHLPRLMHGNTFKRHLSMGGGARVVNALTSGRPVMMVTGHFGNWEIAGYMLGFSGFSTYAIARPIDNPYLDRFLRDFRERTGQRVLAKKGDYDLLRELLAAGAAVATLGDQDAGQRGLFVDFFGRPASTHKAIALLSLEYRVPLLVVGTPKIGEPLQYEVVAEDLILPEEYDGRPDAVRVITQRFTAALERLIRRHPEQYFWLHRRWKHAPKTRNQRKVA